MSTTAERQADSALDNLPPMVRDGRVEPPDALRITEQQAVNMFVAKYPLFDDRNYRKYERDYKWDAHRRVADELLSARGRYSSDPNWTTYNRLLTLSKQLLDRLRPLRARDLIDVQSFMWVVAGMPFMKPPKRKR